MNFTCKAKRAIYAMNSKINLRFLSVKTLLKLFDSLICPILLCGSEVWESYVNQDNEKWDANPIEKVHMQFTKWILGVNRSTSTLMLGRELGVNRSAIILMLRGELGRYSKIKDNNRKCQIFESN